MQQITIQSAGRWGGEIENRTFDLKKALEELIDNYRCGHEKATINLDFQLKSVNRELKQNIAMLEALEEENKTLKEQLKKK